MWFDFGKYLTFLYPDETWEIETVTEDLVNLTVRGRRKESDLTENARPNFIFKYAPSERQVRCIAARSYASLLIVSRKSRPQY
jgi:hypothetical protein